MKKRILDLNIFTINQQYVYNIHTNIQKALHTKRVLAYKVSLPENVYNTASVSRSSFVVSTVIFIIQMLPNPLNAG